MRLADQAPVPPRSWIWTLIGVGVSSEGRLSLMMTLTNQYKGRATCMASVLSLRRRNPTGYTVQGRQWRCGWLWKTELASQGSGDFVELKGAIEGPIDCVWINIADYRTSERDSERESEGVNEIPAEYVTTRKWLLKRVGLSDVCVVRRVIDCTSDRLIL
jgi:hypothetical protein